MHFLQLPGGKAGLLCQGVQVIRGGHGLVGHAGDAGQSAAGGQAHALGGTGDLGRACGDLVRGGADFFQGGNGFVRLSLQILKMIGKLFRLDDKLGIGLGVQVSAGVHKGLLGLPGGLQLFSCFLAGLRQKLLLLLQQRRIAGIKFQGAFNFLQLPLHRFGVGRQILKRFFDTGGVRVKCDCNSFYSFSHINTPRRMPRCRPDPP